VIFNVIYNVTVIKRNFSGSVANALDVYCVIERVVVPLSLL